MKKKGSITVLILWVLFCLPIAIIYAIIRDWDIDNKKNGNGED